MSCLAIMEHHVARKQHHLDQAIIEQLRGPFGRIMPGTVLLEVETRIAGIHTHEILKMPDYSAREARA